MTQVLVAAIQLCSGPDLAANLDAAERQLRAAAAAGARLAVLPENFAVFDAAQYRQVAQQLPAILARLSAMARALDLWIVAGTLPAADRPDGTPVPKGRVRTACHVISATGDCVARYDKIHLFGFKKGDESYNEAAFIDAFCDSVLRQQLPEGWRMEVLIADGESDDGTRERLSAWCAQDARFHMIDNPGRIVSCGLNRCIEASHGEFIVRLDVHTVYAPDYISRCLAVWQETGADNVGGPWRAQGESGPAAAVGSARTQPVPACQYSAQAWAACPVARNWAESLPGEMATPSTKRAGMPDERASMTMAEA